MSRFSRDGVAACWLLSLLWVLVCPIHTVCPVPARCSAAKPDACHLLPCRGRRPLPHPAWRLCSSNAGNPTLCGAEGGGIWGGTRPLQRVTSVQPRTARPWASASPNRMQVRALRQWPAGGSPAVVWSRSRVDLRRWDSSPSVRREALQVHPHPWL